MTSLLQNEATFYEPMSTQIDGLFDDHISVIPNAEIFCNNIYEVVWASGDCQTTISDDQTLHSNDLPSFSTEVPHRQLNMPVPVHQKGSLQLWRFLVAMLDDPCKQHLICWTGRRLEFKLNEPEEVARLWGIQKNRPTMNYDKLSRSLRYYYEKGIIKKVSGERYVYKFEYEPEILSCLSNASEEIHLSDTDIRRRSSVLKTGFDEQASNDNCFSNVAGITVCSSQSPPLLNKSLCDMHEYDASIDNQALAEDCASTCHGDYTCCPQCSLHSLHSSSSHRVYRSCLSKCDPKNTVIYSDHDYFDGTLFFDDEVCKSEEKGSNMNSCVLNNVDDVTKSFVSYASDFELNSIGTFSDLCPSSASFYCDNDTRCGISSANCNPILLADCASYRNVRNGFELQSCQTSSNCIYLENYQ